MFFWVHILDRDIYLQRSVTFFVSGYSLKNLKVLDICMCA